MTQLSGTTTVSESDRTPTPIPIEAGLWAFYVVLDGGWSSRVGVHGGYMCAVAVRGAEMVSPHRVVRTGGLATEHGRITQSDGTVVTESFHTRLTAEG